jgi:hypothetical protein
MLSKFLLEENLNTQGGCGNTISLFLKKMRKKFVSGFVRDI